MFLVEAITMLALAFLAWHLALWPALLGRLAPGAGPGRAPDRGDGAVLPRLAIVVPAHDEAATIAGKIANTAALDYPADRLRLILVLDGCTDATERVAAAALRDPAHRGLEAEVLVLPRNRGKVAALNAGFAAAARADVVIVSDCSADLAADAARRLAAAFADPALGAIGAGYAVPEGGATGEARFWRRQTALKAAEARIAAPMGLHGACYALRAGLAAPLPADTINDDFAIPMRLAAAGWRVAHDPTIRVTEREGSTGGMDFRRRRRIGAGNLQQSLRHVALADPRRPLLALVFLSGKGLRPLVGPAMAVALAGSAVLGLAGGAGFAALALAQAGGYLAAALAGLWPPQDRPRALRALTYAVVAQLASTLGAVDYLARRHAGPWRRVARPAQSIGG